MAKVCLESFQELLELHCTIAKIYYIKKVKSAIQTAIFETKHFSITKPRAVCI